MSIFSFSRKKNKLPQPNFTLPTQNAWLLWCCQCFNIALLGIELSTWMLAIISLVLVWQALLISKKSKSDHQISSFVLGIFAISGCIAITISAQTLGILLSMVHLLSFAYALKAFELKKRSDFYQLFLLGLFLVGSALIFRQSLSFSLVVIAVLIVNLAVLLQFYSHKQPVHKTIKTTLFLLLQSMFLAAILFVVFPRISPFWKVPQANSATTGLSDTVKPGDIAKLARSSKLAFRASFTQGKIPSYSQLYWRAITLENYDGRQWSRARSNGKFKLLDFTPNKLNSEKVNYQVITEPSFQYWLFALAPAISSDNTIKMLSDFTVQSRNIVSQTKAYQLESYLSHPLEINLLDNVKSLNLSLPAKNNPRLVNLGLELKQKYPNPEARANAILLEIRQAQYFYTLEPPLLSNNSLDQFYFDTKSGFCEHYASAFTFIMRASGTPARVVTGYMGGEFNGVSNVELQISDDTRNIKNNSKGHISVYQSDAHAWSEIWVEDKGWLRIDPTGAVDPKRVSSGWSDELLKQQSALNNNLFNMYQLKQFAWINNIRLQFDALDYQWTRWVLGYSTSKQYDLLQQFIGQIKPWKIALLIGGSIALSALILLAFFLWGNYKKRKKINQAPWLIVYQNALKALEKKGLVKLPSTTAQKFLMEIKNIQPEIAIEFARVNASFTRLSYQNLSVKEQELEFKRLKQNYKKFIVKAREF